MPSAFRAISSFETSLKAGFYESRERDNTECYEEAERSFRRDIGEMPMVKISRARSRERADTEMRFHRSRLIAGRIQSGSSRGECFRPDKSNLKDGFLHKRA